MIEDLKDIIRDEMTKQRQSIQDVADAIQCSRRTVMRALSRNGDVGSILVYEEMCHYLGIYITKR